VQTALQRYEIVVCVTGGIAAYKTASLVSTLVQDGAGVTVCMTQNARRFITPLTFRALTGRVVYTSAWNSDGLGDIHHLKLTQVADLAVVAPATANCIAKLAGGSADDLVSALLLGADCPVMMAPSMNTRMWQHPATRRNVQFLGEAGVIFAGPDDGWLACRDVGPGRMVEPAVLHTAILQRLLKSPPRAI
jgi:phosphopantothenoylcysteine decarboxylase/phosphopantothenate--cysteine ligase